MYSSSNSLDSTSTSTDTAVERTLVIDLEPAYQTSSKLVLSFILVLYDTESLESLVPVVLTCLDDSLDLALNPY